MQSRPTEDSKDNARQIAPEGATWETGGLPVPRCAAEIHERNAYPSANPAMNMATIAARVTGSITYDLQASGTAGEIGGKARRADHATADLGCHRA